MSHNILYIEDNPDNMMLVQRALEARGYHLLKAMKGVEGVTTAESEQVDLILLDINLPDIDGYEVQGACVQAISVNLKQCLSLL
jgi:Response regulator containing a CheY-like receiver domain and an HD-GYP domain